MLPESISKNDNIMGFQKRKGYNLTLKGNKRKPKKSKKEKIENNINSALNNSILRETALGPATYQSTNLPLLNPK